MTSPIRLSATDIADALERRIASGDDIDAVLGAVVDPLIAEHGAEAVISELEDGKDDPRVASALAYAADEADVPLTQAFTHDEILTAALEYLLTVGTPAWEESRARNCLYHGHWAWFALYDHHPGEGRGDFEDDEHFRLVLELVERAPLNNDVLWMIGDGPLAHAVPTEAHLANLRSLMETNEKLALTWRLNEVDWPYGTP
jgi:hypothetical protein